MSKRKRASLGKTPSTPPAGSEVDDSTDDAAVKEDMAHVSPDLLAGSPDIFAGEKTGAFEEPEAVSEPIYEPAPVEAEPTEASTTLTPEESPQAFAEPAAQPPTAPPPYVDAVPYPPRPRRTGSSAALGIVLVVVGLFALAVVMSGVDLTENGWPLFILIPGLTLLVVGFISFGSVATIPGGIVTMLGLVLAYAMFVADVYRGRTAG